jgi:hypothetical protein
MRIKNVLFGATLVGATALITSQVVSQDPTQDEMMARWMELATPGKHHEKLGVFVGTWEQTVKMWMAPDAPPTVNTAEATYEWMLDGRFLKGTYKGEFNGMPFEGQDITGYDNFRKEYVSVWMDNMSTGLMMSRGQWNDAENALVMRGTIDDLMQGKQDLPKKDVIRVVNEDENTFESWVQGPDGEMMKVMEIVSRRVR